MLGIGPLLSYQINLRGGAGGVLDHESRRKKSPFHSFTMKINPFHVSRRKTRANSTMSGIKVC